MPDKFQNELAAALAKRKYGGVIFLWFKNRRYLETCKLDLLEVTIVWVVVFYNYVPLQKSISDETSKDAFDELDDLLGATKKVHNYYFRRK